MELYREQQLTQQNLRIKAAMNQSGARLVLSVVFEMLGEVNHHFFSSNHWQTMQDSIRSAHGFYTSTSGHGYKNE